jgi:hypothetical protein
MSFELFSLKGRLSGRTLVENKSIPRAPHRYKSNKNPGSFSLFYPIPEWEPKKMDSSNEISVVLAIRGQLRPGFPIGSG